MVIAEMIQKEVNKVVGGLKGKIVYFLCDGMIVRGKVEIDPETGNPFVRGSTKEGETMIFDLASPSPFFFSKQELVDAIPVIDLAKNVK